MAIESVTMGDQDIAEDMEIFGLTRYPTLKELRSVDPHYQCFFSPHCNVPFLQKSVQEENSTDVTGEADEPQQIH